MAAICFNLCSGVSSTSDVFGIATGSMYVGLPGYVCRDYEPCPATTQFARTNRRQFDEVAMTSNRLTPEQLRDAQRTMFQAIRDEMWKGLSPKQQAFLSLPELTREGNAYVLRENGTTAWLAPCGDTIQLSMIKTTPSERRQGNASKLLKKICELANRVGVTLSLRAEPKDAKTDLDQQQLIAWYSRHGFKGNWNNMTRPPSQNTDSETRD
jgi:GNAT superfamily N-acetyltransferase